MGEKIYDVWFSKLDRLSIKKKHMLIKYKTVKEIYEFSKRKLKSLKYLSEKNIENIMDKNIRNEAYKDLEYIEKNNIEIININDKRYPENLKQIYDPPISIYVKGNENILNKESIAIVGCRSMSKYGEKAAMYFSKNLAREKINIVSGLARGIDSVAHIGAIMEEGVTIAVIGSGIDIEYPKENAKIYKDIVRSGGAIISEYPLGTKPMQMNFPARNRIISGISNKILVVEAKLKSGTLITVDFALDQNKEIYVVPGNINEENAQGTNYLIKEGANVALKYTDLVD